MKKILFILLVMNVTYTYAQEEKDVQLKTLKEEEIKLPQLQPGNDNVQAPEKPEPPAYIYDTHLPPSGRKKEVEEAETRAYARPELNLPEGSTQEN